MKKESIKDVKSKIYSHVSNRKGQVKKEDLFFQCMSLITYSITSTSDLNKLNDWLSGSWGNIYGK